MGAGVVTAPRIIAPPGAVSGAFILGRRRAGVSSAPMMVGAPIPEADADVLRENFGEVTETLEAAYRDGFNEKMRERRAK